MAGKVGMMAGAFGLALVTFWDDISSAIGTKDRVTAPAQIAAATRAPRKEPDQTDLSERDQDMSHRRADVLDLAAFRLEEAGLDPAPDAKTLYDDSTHARPTGSKAPQDDALGAVGDAPGQQTTTPFWSPYTAGDDSPAIIRRFNPETDVITVQYDPATLPETPIITVTQSEGGQNSEVFVNGESRGTIVGAGGLQASDIAVIEMSE